MRINYLPAEEAELLRVIVGVRASTRGQDSVLYNGTPVSQLQSRHGIDIRKLATFVPANVHFEGNLTVLETLTFSATVAPGAIHFRARAHSVMKGRASLAADGSATTSPAEADGSATTSPAEAAAAAQPGEAEGGSSPAVPMSPSLFSPLPPTDSPPPDAAGADAAASARLHEAPSPAHHASAAAEAAHFERIISRYSSPDVVAIALHRLGLAPVAHTLVCRLSPPQLRMLAAAEALFSGPRVMAVEGHLDGLPGPYQAQLAARLREWAAGTGATLVISAGAAPSAAVLEHVDQVAVVAGGAVVYAGTPDGLADYWCSVLGYPMSDAEVPLPVVIEAVAQEPHSGAAVARCFAAAAAAAVPSHTFASLAEAWRAHQRQQQHTLQLGVEAAPAAAAAAAAATGADGKPLAAEAAAAAAAAGDATSVAVAAAASGGDWGGDVAFTRARFGRRRVGRYCPLLCALLDRRVRIVARSPIWWAPKVFLALVFGVFLGSLYLHPPFSNFSPKASLASYVCMVIAAGASMESRAVIHAVRVIHGHMDRGWYGPSLPATSVLLTAVPFSLLSTLVFSLAIYYMIGYVDEPGRFFFFWLVAFCVDAAITMLFRFLAMATLNVDSIRGVTGLFMLFYLFCAGFLLVHDHMNPAMMSIYWTNPFSWALRSIVLNEWTADAYGQQVPVLTAQGAMVGTETLGQFYSSNFRLQWDPPMGWKWAGPGYLLGYAALFGLLLNPLALMHCRARAKPRRTVPPPALLKAEAVAGAAAGAAAAVIVSAGAGAAIKVGDDAATPAQAAGSVVVVESAPAAAASLPAAATALLAPPPAATVAAAAVALRVTVPARTVSTAHVAIRDSGSFLMHCGHVTAVVYSAAELIADPLGERLGGSSSNSSTVVTTAVRHPAAALPVVDGIVAAVCHPQHAPAGFAAALVYAGTPASRPADGSAVRNPLAAADALPSLAAAAPPGSLAAASVVVVPEGAYPWAAGDTLEAALRFAAALGASPSAARVEHALALTLTGPYRRLLLASLPAGTWQHTAAAIALELCTRPEPAATAAGAGAAMAGSASAPPVGPAASVPQVLLVRDPFAGLTARAAERLSAVLRNVATDAVTATGAGGATGVPATGPRPRIVMVACSNAGAGSAWVERGADAVVPLTHRVHTRLEAAAAAAAEAAQPRPQQDDGGAAPAAAATSPLPVALHLGERSWGVVLWDAFDWLLLPLLLLVVRRPLLAPPAPPPQPQPRHRGCRCALLILLCAWTVPRDFALSLALLLRRQFATSLRRPLPLLVARYVALPLALCLFVGTLFYDLNTADSPGVSAHVALVFISTVFAAFLAASSAATAALEGRPALYAELGAGLYAPEALVAALAVHEAVWATVPAVLWTVVPFAMAGLVDPPPSAADAGAGASSRMGLHFLAVWAAQVAGSLLGTLCAYLGPHLMGEWVIEQLAVTVCGILSGVFVPQPQVPATWSWLHEAIPFSHALKTALAATFYCDPVAAATAGAGPCPTITLIAPTGVSVQTQYGYLGARYGFAYADRWMHYGAAVGIAACIAAACALALRALRVPWSHLAARTKHHHQH